MDRLSRPDVLLRAVGATREDIRLARSAASHESSGTSYGSLRLSTGKFEGSCSG